MIKVSKIKGKKYIMNPNCTLYLRGDNYYCSREAPHKSHVHRIRDIYNPNGKEKVGNAVFCGDNIIGMFNVIWEVKDTPCK